MFASNFWDIATYTTKNASKLAGEDLEEYVLEEFQGNLSAVLSAIEVGGSCAAVGQRRSHMQAAVVCSLMH